MTNDLEARVVQAAREAVARVVRDEPGQPSPETIACVLAGRLDETKAVRFAILGARAALAEIERDGVVVPREPTDLMLAVAAREASTDMPIQWARR